MTHRHVVLFNLPLQRLLRRVTTADLGEEDTRVSGSHGDGRNRNHHSVEDEKLGLVLHEGVAPSADHLGYTVALQISLWTFYISNPYSSKLWG